MNMRHLFFIALAGFVFAAYGQLSVAVSDVKLSGQKAVVPLQLENHLPSAIESARAAVFILDDQGKMLGQSTRWVIGGSRETKGLAAGGTNLYHFVVPLQKAVSTTNIIAKVTFTRVVLEGGKLADISKDLQIQNR